MIANGGCPDHNGTAAFLYYREQAIHQFDCPKSATKCPKNHKKLFFLSRSIKPGVFLCVKEAFCKKTTTNKTKTKRFI